MNPSVYLYRPLKQSFELYLGEYDTLSGLSALDEHLNVKLLSIGASSYQKYGWATEKEFPQWQTVGEVKAFFKQTGEFGLIEFELDLIDFGTLTTHDDGECRFVFKDRKNLIDLVKKVALPIHSDIIVAGILENPGKYIEVSENGELMIYDNFDQYLKNSPGLQKS